MPDPLAPERILDDAWWGAHGFPHEAAAALRERSPVWRYEGGVVDPFWMVTRHADIRDISRDPVRFTSTKRTIVEQGHGEASPLRSIVQMDPPEHEKYRDVITSWLSPGNVRRMQGRLREISTEIVDELAGKESCDFVAEVATLHPLRMICELLGIPREGEGEVLRLAKSLFGSRDPDHGVGEGHTMAIPEVLEWCRSLAEARRAHPTDDLASALANAKIDGDDIGLLEVMSHLVVLITAGHDTTASAISGGMHALIQHPDELEKLRRDPKRIQLGVEELVRWVTPTTNFLRTTTEDVEIRGVRIPKGDDVYMSYAAANRDPDVFDEPNVLRIDRRPNPHLGFGIGTHGCVGQVLARLEMQTLFEELLPRLESVELDGEPAWVQAIWVHALKRLPVRLQVREAAA